MKNRKSKLETRSSPRFSSFEFRVSALIFALAGLLMGCRSQAPSTADFYPASNSVPGWMKSSETRTFEASHLFEYIDGDADKYVQAGVVKTLSSKLTTNPANL